MAGLRVKRTWWIAQQQERQAEPPLFRLLSRRWAPVDHRERRAVPFRLALPAADTPPAQRVAPKPSRIAVIAEQMKKSKRTWNAWLHIK